MTTTPSTERNTVTLNAEIPQYLYKKINDMMASGDFVDVNNFVTIALTYFISSYRLGNPAEKEL